MIFYSSKTKKLRRAAYLAVILLGGWVTPAIAQSVYGNPPPQMTVNPKDNTAMIWGNQSSFGPIPASERARSKEVCSRLKHHFVPEGYHPQALDPDGKPYIGGGFFCVRT